jgi:uncharacterized membrane protein YGL010W
VTARRAGADHRRSPARGPGHRPHPLLAGVVGAAVAGVLWLAADSGRVPLGVAVLAAQLVLAAAWIVLLDVPAGLAALTVVALAALAGDAVLLRSRSATLGDLAGVLGLGLAAGLAGQLARRPRPRVADALAAVLSGVVLTAFLASLLALENTAAGRSVALTALAAVAAVLLAGRLLDVAVPRPRLGPSRGWPGLLGGAGAGMAAGAGYAAGPGQLGPADGVLVTAAAVAAAALADLLLDAGADGLPAAPGRRQAALRPVVALLPVAAAVAAVYPVGRALVG